MPRSNKSLHIEDPCIFRKKLFLWCSRHSPSAFFDSHQELYTERGFSSYDCVAGVGSISYFQNGQADNLTALRDYHQEKKDWVLGYFSYELKNELEDLSSENPDFLLFPVMHFFQPEYLFLLSGSRLSILFQEDDAHNGRINHIIREILETEVPANLPEYKINIIPRMQKKEYIAAVEQLRKHIKRGDIYEANLCQEFYAEEVNIEPSETFLKLREISPAPFSCWYHSGNHYLLCESPERFLKKESNRVISQPIKGTCQRGTTPSEDETFRKKLQEDPKERSENIMITDLVRNDLSRTSKKGSVRVEELCGIYAFPQVFQMISTVTSEFRSEFHWTDLIRTCFPMGSMTGAPKIRAMELIEKYEKSQRGLYSGSVGYVTPEGDFDFNVVIRSILYNRNNNYLSFHTGGAITWASEPEKEYRECLLKAKGMLRVLNPALSSFHGFSK
jgi:para-aminobenzoate synthetase component I